MYVCACVPFVARSGWAPAPPPAPPRSASSARSGQAPPPQARSGRRRKSRNSSPEEGQIRLVAVTRTSLCFCMIVCTFACVYVCTCACVCYQAHGEGVGRQLLGQVNPDVGDAGLHRRGVPHVAEQLLFHPHDVPRDHGGHGLGQAPPACIGTAGPDLLGPNVLHLRHVCVKACVCVSAYAHICVYARACFSLCVYLLLSDARSSRLAHGDAEGHLRLGVGVEGHHVRHHLRLCRVVPTTKANS